jgi:hypothetical protein
LTWEAFCVLGGGVAETFSPISVSVMRAELRALAARCVGTLQACLLAELTKASVNVNGGQVVSATAANAHSVSFSEPGKGGPTPSAYQAMWESLITLYEEIVAALPADPAPTDADILREMLYQLQPARTVTNSYAGLRYA